MIMISEIALNVLSEGLQASGIERAKGLRLKEENERLTLELDTPKKADRVILYNDQMVLIIDPGFEASIGDAFIDMGDTAEGPDLILSPARSWC